MKEFTTQYASQIKGVLSGFDRLLFAGTLRPLAYPGGMALYLRSHDVRLVDFKDFCSKTSQAVREASEAAMRAAGRPVVYLTSSRVSKEAQAQAIAQADGITEGPVCLLECVEPCQTFSVRGNRQSQHLQLYRQNGKCLHLYRYALHPTFGWMYARLQTWFPFGLQVYLNGHAWLARQMDQAGIGYVRAGNCFVHIDDGPAAQALYDAQLQTDWVEALQAIGHEVHPGQEALLARFRTDYYWSVRQSEFATDVVFADEAQLRRLYPRWLEYAMTALGSGDVLRFLGRRVPADGALPARFAGEVSTDLKTRSDGVRIKHWLNHNSVKMYDKAHTPVGSVLRIETTVYDETDFRVYRPAEGADEQTKQWRVLRRGVADVYRRAEVCQRANERYLDALAQVEVEQTLGEVLEALVKPTTWKGKRVRALRPFDPADLALLQAVGRGEFTLNGLRNRNLQALLYADAPADANEARRRSAACTRKLRLLRAHGLLAKVAHTHRYVLTDKGRTLVTALVAACRTPISQLLKAAA